MFVCVTIALDLYLLIIPCLFVSRSNRQHSKSHQNIFGVAKVESLRKRGTLARFLVSEFSSLLISLYSSTSVVDDYLSCLLSG